MLSAMTLPFMPAKRALRRHRAEFQAQLAVEPAVRLLPRLLSLPLAVEPLPEPEAVLALRSSFALCGPPAGGRTLALLQTAARWAESTMRGLVLYLPLAEADLPNLSPRAVVAGAAHRAGFSPEFAEGQRPGLLLIDDWELLPADRRALWQHFIVGGAAQWSALRSIVALPQGEPWSGLRPLTLTAPDDTQLARWLAHLLPEHDPAPILAALACEPLAALRGSVADLLLLALTYAFGGLPASRAQLYERAYALVRPVLADEPTVIVDPRRVGLLDAAGATEPAVRVQIGRALLRHYRLARGLAGGHDLATLPKLSAVERAAVAPLAAGLLDDPIPVLEALWANGDETASLQALSACVREAPTRAPLFGLRLLEHVTGPGSANEPNLLAQLAVTLPALLTVAARLDEQRTLAALRAAAAALPGHQSLWLQLCDDQTAPSALRWAAAELVAAAGLDLALLTALPEAAPPAALVPRAWIAALAGQDHRAALMSGPLHAALTVLLQEDSFGERRVAVASALLDDPNLPEHLRALALRSVGVSKPVEQMASSSSATLRGAALATLRSSEPGASLVALGRALTDAAGTNEAKHEILDTIAAVADPRAVGQLIRAMLDEQLSLSLRLYALALLAQQGAAGTHSLRRLLATTALPTLLRTAAATHLGRLGAVEALPALAALLSSSAEPLLRRAAAVALGELAQQPGQAEQAATALAAGLRHSAIDTILGEQIVQALGRSRTSAALTSMVGLLDPGLPRYLEAIWRRVAPELERTPALAWPELSLPTPTRLALLDLLADGSTMADPPSRVAELVTRQAIRLAIAATLGLVELTAAPELRAPVVAALRRALTNEPRTEVARAALVALGRISEPANILATLLDDPQTSPTLRWLAIESLAGSLPTLEVLHQRLEQNADEPFVQARAIEALGSAGYIPALAALRSIARGVTYDSHLRRAALIALGQLATPEATVTLVALATDCDLPAELRAVAATALPAQLGQSERLTLRHTLRTERLSPELLSALARALARSGDPEALQYLMRSAQSDIGVEATASIEAIAALGELSASQLLVRLSQSPLAVPGVRLSAVTALLKLCGTEYLPLLREYLVATAPPLRIQAHAALLASNPDDPRLSEPLIELDAPLALRLQALKHLVAHDPEVAVIGDAVANPDEQPQVRLSAAMLLAEAQQPAAVASLVSVLTPPQPTAAPILRHRCITSLGLIARRDGPAASAAHDCLLNLASDPAQPAEHCHWASQLLLERV